MRIPVLGALVLVALAGCGQIAATDAEKREQTAQDPRAPAPGGPAAAGAPDAPPDMAPSAAPISPPPPGGVCGVSASVRSFSSADDQAVALHGLWVTCTSNPAPSMCPPSDPSVFFGALDGVGGASPDPASRRVACGHLTTHGDGFVANPTFTFTYDVENLAPSGSPPSYAVYVSNDTIQHTFALTYRDGMATTGSPMDATITLGEPDGAIGSLRRSAFTTF